MAQSKCMVKSVTKDQLALCRLLHRRNVEDAISVNVKANIDFRRPAWHWRDAIETKLAKEVVVFRHGTFSLEDLDEHAWLVVSIGGECLGFLSRNRRIAFDKGGEHTTGSLKA